MVAQYFASVGDGLMRALRDRPTALERWTSGVRPGMKLGTGPKDKDADAFYQKRVPKGAPDYLESVEITFPERPQGRGDLPDRDRGAGLVRPDGHAHLPPLAGPPRRRRPARRAPDRPRPPAGDDVRRRGAGRGRRARAARGARSPGLRQDQRQPWRPRLRPDRAALGVRRRPARCDRLRPRAGEARRRRHDGLVEGGAGRADLRRLQPELPRPHHRLGVLPAADPRRAGLDADDLGRAGRRSPTPPPTTCSRVPERLADGDPWAGIDDEHYSIEPLLELFEEQGSGRAATTRRTTRRCPASRPACSPARRSTPTGTSRATASPTDARRPLG